LKQVHIQVDVPIYECRCRSQVTVLVAQPQHVDRLINEYEEVTHGLDEQILVHVGLDTAGVRFAFVPDDLRKAGYAQSV
jgi:hypothetical protein